MPDPSSYPQIQALTPGFFLLSALTLLLVFILILLIESTVLQMLGWGDRKATWLAALKFNLVSVVLTAPLLAMARQWGEGSLWLAWGLSILLESWMLTRLRPGAARYNGLCALLANTASFLILILPSFHFA